MDQGIKAKAGIDYHVEVDWHYYSVPHALVGEYVRVRATDSTVECFFKGGRVAAHVRSYLKGKHTTLPEHMPSAHRKHMKWTPGGCSTGARTSARARAPSCNGNSRIVRIPSKDMILHPPMRRSA
jgi:hypothetical protein